VGNVRKPEIKYKSMGHNLLNFGALTPTQLL